MHDVHSKRTFGYLAWGSREAHKLDKLHLHRQAGVARDIVLARDESRCLKKPPAHV